MSDLESELKQILRTEGFSAGKDADPREVVEGHGVLRSYAYFLMSRQYAASLDQLHEQHESSQRDREERLRELQNKWDLRLRYAKFVEDGVVRRGKSKSYQELLDEVDREYPDIDALMVGLMQEAEDARTEYEWACEDAEERRNNCVYLALRTKNEEWRGLLGSRLEDIPEGHDEEIPNDVVGKVYGLLKEFQPRRSRRIMPAPAREELEEPPKVERFGWLKRLEERPIVGLGAILSGCIIAGGFVFSINSSYNQNPGPAVERVYPEESDTREFLRYGQEKIDEIGAQLHSIATAHERMATTDFEQMVESREFQQRREEECRILGLLLEELIEWEGRVVPHLQSDSELAAQMAELDAEVWLLNTRKLIYDLMFHYVGPVDFTYEPGESVPLDYSRIYYNGAPVHDIQFERNRLILTLEDPEAVRLSHIVDRMPTGPCDGIAEVTLRDRNNDPVYVDIDGVTNELREITTLGVLRGKQRPELAFWDNPTVLLNGQRYSWLELREGIPYAYTGNDDDSFYTLRMYSGQQTFLFDVTLPDFAE